jgi:hypothetical protein
VRVLAFYSGKELDQHLAEAFVAGAAVHGHEATALPGEHPENPDAEVVMLFGVKARLRFDDYRGRGVQTVMVDKGYYRGTVESYGRKACKYWRLAVNAHHPTGYLPAMAMPGDRLAALPIERKAWRADGEHILLAGSSAKYHGFNGLAEPTGYAQGVVRRLRKLCDRPVVYRPKPSWKEAQPIRGTRFSRQPESINAALAGAWAMVTNGSNACFEAVLAGVPVIVLGDAVARPLSSTRLGDIEAPRLAGDAEVERWLGNIAYCQWTIEEMAAGAAWNHVKDHLL